MSLLMPTSSVNNVTDIDIELLKHLKIESIFLDVDNTIASHRSEEPFEGTVKWVHKILEQNINIVIISNNLRKRVAPLAKKFDLPFISLAFKPLPFGFYRANKLIKSKHENIMVIGDQVFTDILGANLSHMKSILLLPRTEKETLSIFIRRKIEKRIREKIKNNNKNK